MNLWCNISNVFFHQMYGCVRNHVNEDGQIFE